jgi:hypothetical protein
MSLPAPEKKIAARATALDDFVPAYQFAELHSIRIKAGPRAAFAAIRNVTADEITLFPHVVTWIRRFGRRNRKHS